MQQSLQAAASTETPGGDIDEDVGSVSRMEDVSVGPLAPANNLGSVPGLLTQHALDPALVEQLLPEQRRAFNIVQHHLARTLEAIHTNTPPPEQLMMLLVGEGGQENQK
ncbi:hypothetical protein FRC12_017572 [Ceratobasidium sp. 428]|nr:hypothetical protein FRC12_017572 [Ceratobasidium sp. 428]